jgi:hypothetical protein
MFKQTCGVVFFFLASEAVFCLYAAQADVLSFFPPKQLTTLLWSDMSEYGVPATGAEWLVVDNQGRFWLEADRDFNLYSPGGHYLKKMNPIDKVKNFYGFDSMEALGDGRVVLLERLESHAEQFAKDNFELRSKPGVHLVVLSGDGKLETDKDLVDPSEPHSNYQLERGDVYSIHDDGTYQLLDTIGSPGIDKAFSHFASVAFNKDQWLHHLKTIPVFHYKNQVYHDIKGNAHVDIDAKSSLMGQPLVENTAPLAEKDGKIYYRVVCYENSAFANFVFVDDPIQKKYAMIRLIDADQRTGVVYGHALFVDEKGNLFEGVAKRNGYRIYEWKILR